MARHHWLAATAFVFFSLPAFAKTGFVFVSCTGIGNDDSGAFEITAFSDIFYGKKSFKLEDSFAHYLENTNSEHEFFNDCDIHLYESRIEARQERKTHANRVLEVKNRVVFTSFMK